MNTATLPAAPLSVLPSTFSGMARVANSVPMLDEDREIELVRAWSRDRSLEAARELVLAHLRLVIKCVRDHQGYGLSKEDMTQEGLVGLMKAVHRFRLGMGVRLGVFARHWIVAQIREYIFHNWRIVRLGSGKAMRKLFFGYRSTVERLDRLDPGSRPSMLADQVAKALGVEPDQVRQASGFLLSSDASLEVPGEGEGANSNNHALVPWSSDTLDILEKQDYASKSMARLHAALDALPARERDIIHSRHLVEPPQTLRELADRHGVSIERVRQIEKRAMEMLSGQVLA